MQLLLDRQAAALLVHARAPFVRFATAPAAAAAAFGGRRRGFAGSGGRRTRLVLARCARSRFIAHFGVFDLRVFLRGSLGFAPNSLRGLRLRRLPHALARGWSRSLPLNRLLGSRIVLLLGLPFERRLVELFQLGQLLQVSYVLILQVSPGFRLLATVVVNRISLDVVLADHLRDRTNRLYVVMKIGDVQEARLLQADVDECRLHPGQHAGDLAFVDVAGKAAMLLAFEIELVQRAVFE